MSEPLITSIINREALVLFRRLVGERVAKPGIEPTAELRTDVYVSDNDLRIPLDEFSERFIKPCVSELAAAIPHGSKVCGDVFKVKDRQVVDRVDGVAMATEIVEINGRQALIFAVGIHS